MKSTLVRFLVRYWLLVVIVPSIVIPTYSFFHDFTDINDFSFAEIRYEISKYLLPAILIFLGASVASAVVFVLIDVLILPTMIMRMSYSLFKISFLLFSSILIVSPPLLWYLSGNKINTGFASLVIPAYVISAVLWSALLVRPKKFESWRNNITS